MNDKIRLQIKQKKTLKVKIRFSRIKNRELLIFLLIHKTVTNNNQNLNYIQALKLKRKALVLIQRTKKSIFNL